MRLCVYKHTITAVSESTTMTSLDQYIQTIRGACKWVRNEENDPHGCMEHVVDYLIDQINEYYTDIDPLKEGELLKELEQHVHDGFFNEVMKRYQISLGLC